MIASDRETLPIISCFLENRLFEAENLSLAVLSWVRIRLNLSINLIVSKTNNIAQGLVTSWFLGQYGAFGTRNFTFTLFCLKWHPIDPNNTRKILTNPKQNSDLYHIHLICTWTNTFALKICIHLSRGLFCTSSFFRIAYTKPRRYSFLLIDNFIWVSESR